MPPSTVVPNDSVQEVDDDDDDDDAVIVRTSNAMDSRCNLQEQQGSKQK
jgi:hypothetical protein